MADIFTNLTLIEKNIKLCAQTLRELWKQHDGVFKKVNKSTLIYTMVESYCEEQLLSLIVALEENDQIFQELREQLIANMTKDSPDSPESDS